MRIKFAQASISPVVRAKSPRILNNLSGLPMND